MLVRRYFEIEDPTHGRPDRPRAARGRAATACTVRGIIDRLELDADGELVVTDYKTGSVPGERWEHKSLAGVHIYSLLCEQMFGRRPARVQLLYLSKPEAIIAEPTEQSVERASSMRTDGAVVGDRRRACARRLPPEPGRAVRLLHVPAVLPGVRRRSRARPTAARARRGDRAHAPAARPVAVGG